MKKAWWSKKKNNSRRAEPKFEYKWMGDGAMFAANFRATANLMAFWASILHASFPLYDVYFLSFLHTYPSPRTAQHAWAKKVFLLVKLVSVSTTHMLFIIKVSYQRTPSKPLRKDTSFHFPTLVGFGSIGNSACRLNTVDTPWEKEQLGHTKIHYTWFLIALPSIHISCLLPF